MTGRDGEIEPTPSAPNKENILTQTFDVPEELFPYLYADFQKGYDALVILTRDDKERTTYQIEHYVSKNEEEIINIFFQQYFDNNPHESISIVYQITIKGYKRFLTKIIRGMHNPQEIKSTYYLIDDGHGNWSKLSLDQTPSAEQP